jgi:hypothetical protein
MTTIETECPDRSNLITKSEEELSSSRYNFRGIGFLENTMDQYGSTNVTQQLFMDKNHMFA